LAGSEAAWQLARAGVSVVLHEMRPVRGTEAHVGAGLAELVCSNSFRSDDAQRNAVGLLHEEMRQCGSVILRAADAHKVPAGGEAIGRLTGEESLAFFDAIAPIVHRDTIDFDKAWFQSRYDKEGPGGGVADYINCPLDQAEYEAFVAALLAGDKTEFHEWEKK